MEQERSLSGKSNTPCNSLSSLSQCERCGEYFCLTHMIGHILDTRPLAGRCVPKSELWN